MATVQDGGADETGEPNEDARGASSSCDPKEADQNSPQLNQHSELDDEVNVGLDQISSPKDAVGESSAARRSSKHTVITDDYSSIHHGAGGSQAEDPAP